MLDLIPTILGAVVAILLVYAFVARKNVLEAKALLADTTIRYEAAQQQLQKIDQSSKAQKEQIEKLRQQAQKAEKAAEDIKNKSSDGKLEIIRLKTEYENQLRKVDSQREHLLEQVGVMTQQLSEVVKEKKLITEELNTLRRESEAKTSQITEALRSQVSDLQNQVQAAKRERNNALTAMDKFKAESGLVKPEELKRWQLKVARLEQLYSSMKGLREMAEERNENWETALRFFAIHILGKKADLAADAGGDDPAKKVSIGALVGEALEKIGATLVVDDAQEAPYVAAPSSAELAATQLS